MAIFKKGNQLKTTESQKRAVESHQSRLKVAGHVRLTLMLTPQAGGRLAELSKTHGSRTKAIEWLLAQSNLL